MTLVKENNNSPEKRRSYLMFDTMVFLTPTTALKEMPFNYQGHQPRFFFLLLLCRLSFFFPIPSSKQEDWYPLLFQEAGRLYFAQGGLFLLFFLQLFFPFMTRTIIAASYLNTFRLRRACFFFWFVCFGGAQGAGGIGHAAPSTMPSARRGLS